MPTITEPAKLRAATAYNAAADHFDDEPLGFWKRYGERTVERLALRSGAGILDVGCGTGASVLPAAIQVGPTGEVVGVDLAERMLEIARQKAESRHLANVEFRFGDMEHLGYTIVIGPGFRSIVDQLGPQAAEQVREANLAWIRSRDITSVETNVIYASACKPESSPPMA